MELQVWSRTTQPQVPQGQEEDQADQHVGCVSVDLSPLSFGLPQVSGWYHITDFTGAVCGQLKVGGCLLVTWDQAQLADTGQCPAQK